MTTVIDSHLRCPRCSKRMVISDDDGITRVHECWHCEYSRSERYKAQPAPPPPPEGRVVPLVYDQTPFPDVDWATDEPALFDATPPAPANHERVGDRLLTGWCQRCQHPGQAYTACRCNLPPDRYVRPGGDHA